MSKKVSDIDYHSLNALLNLYDNEGQIQFQADKEAVRQYFLQHVNQNMVWHHDLKEKIDYLVDNNYYESELFDLYSFEEVKQIFKQAYGYKFRFPTFLGAFKYYSSYTLKTFDGSKYLERFEDRVSIVALYLAQGDVKQASKLVDAMVVGGFQPATPTFLNAGKKQRGELISCFLVKMNDTMESIADRIKASLQLSKRGGGVGLLLTDLREQGAPIKNMEGQASGVIPVMKLLEDSFSYANQLGQRQGAGAVYLHAHHPDIMRFLDTKRENADEKVRIKTLSLGVVIPDITYELAKKNEDMYLFSPYDIQKVYGVPMSEISVTEKYYEMVDDARIRKSKINARAFFQTIAEIQFESGYPYIMFEDTVNRENAIKGRINLSNLCSEILQINTPSTYDESGDYLTVGRDISCNLGSLNIAKAMDSQDLGTIVETAIRALTQVSDLSDIQAVKSIANGNAKSHSVGLGQMNLHGFLAREGIHYGSEEALDFTNIYFYTVNYHTIRASNKIAKEKKEVFEGFKDSTYATGEYFDKYIHEDWGIKTEKVQDMVKRFGFYPPTKQDWAELASQVKTHGLYNMYRQAVAPTGSISYIQHSTSSIHPITSEIEIRKEGKLGRVYYPAPFLTNENREYFTDAYEIGYEKIIDTYAVAQQHIDQGMSLTLFFKDTATTRDINKAQIYAWKKGIKTIYYIRLRQLAMAGTGVEECVSCQI